MRPELWKIFDKKGDSLNLTFDAYLDMVFSTDSGVNASGYAITDPSGLVTSTKVTNGGWNYDASTLVYLDYTFGQFGPIPVSANIQFADVSVFIPTPINSKSIKTVDISSNEVFVYPAVVYIGAIFLTPVSQGLVETEHLTIVQELPDGTFVSPFDEQFPTLVFKLEGDETNISFFTVDQHTQEVTWADEVLFDISTYRVNQGIQLNIGFKSDEEGVYERKLRAYHRVNDVDYPLMEVVVNAQSIGQDERLDTLLENFGLYKPKAISNLFKEADINEALPDWQLLNYKAKHMILEHDQIMPYIGTYKGLINAIKWLGYEDIDVKEWFKDVKENKLLSLHVPYDADGRKKTIKYFSPEERKNLKKLNQLSLVYCITRETGEVDEWGTPMTENCYEYNLDEILIKLYSLKKWLETNIIGVNARIYDLTGEGVYFERFQNFIYGTYAQGSETNLVQSLTPTTIGDNSELISGDASIMLTLKEYSSSLKLGDLDMRIIDLARYGWNPSLGYFSPEEYNLEEIDPSTVFIGSPFISPFKDLYDIQWKVSALKEYGVLTTHFVTNPLFIHENEILFYNEYDVSSLFRDPVVDLQTAYLRDPSIDVWVDSIAYSIYRETDSSGNYTGRTIVEPSVGTRMYAWQVSLMPTSYSTLQYAFDDNYKVPLLLSSGFTWVDCSGNRREFDKPYYLDIVDGKISMSADASSLGDRLLIGDDITNDASTREYTKVYSSIDFNYDTSLDEQMISLNVVYIGPRQPIFSFDPSSVVQMYTDPGFEPILEEDNSTYKMNVNHTGDYEIEVFGWNGHNNMFFNFGIEPYQVWQKYPKISSYIDASYAASIGLRGVDSSMSLIDSLSITLANQKPVFDRQVPLQGLSVKTDDNGEKYIEVPSITYFQDVPLENSLCRFYNLTERITSIPGSTITIDDDFQKFYAGDTISLVKFDKGKFSSLVEVSTYIASVSNPSNPTICTLGYTPSSFQQDPSAEWYAINSTFREVTNGVVNSTLRTFTCDVSSYSFRDNQLVAIIVEDTVTGYSWGSTFNTLDASVIAGQNGYRHTFSGTVPGFVLDNPRYNIYAKHAFTTYTNFQIDVSKAYEVNNTFRVYLNDDFYHQGFLDNTFVFVNILFDQQIVLEQWYNPSDNLIVREMHGFDESISVDSSTLVILQAGYDSSNYMLDQKNIWEVWYHNPKDLVLRVYNPVVQYIFDKPGDYDIYCEAYDKYGNLKKQSFEGLIHVK